MDLQKLQQLVVRDVKQEMMFLFELSVLEKS
jgi:hypothetical protein